MNNLLNSLPLGLSNLSDEILRRLGDRFGCLSDDVLRRLSDRLSDLLNSLLYGLGSLLYLFRMFSVS
jgi:hypothetical protein